MNGLRQGFIYPCTIQYTKKYIYNMKMDKKERTVHNFLFCLSEKFSLENKVFCFFFGGFKIIPWVVLYKKFCRQKWRIY